MIDFLLTSTIPYWILFILSIGSVGFCLWTIFDQDKLPSDSRLSSKAMYAVTGVMLFVAICMILIYASGKNALWWQAPEGASYLSILFRTFLLLVFLIFQGLAPLVYKRYMEDYFGCPLSIKSQFISLVVVVPVALIVFMLFGQLFMEEQDRNLWFYIVAGTGIVGSAVYSFWSNSKSVGKGAGILYTVTTFVLCVGTLITLLFFIVALFSAFAAMAPLVACLFAVWFLFGSSFSKVMLKAMEDNSNRMRY
ncbi:MAG: hypothetical protein K2L11_09115 [Muribaculaceae bacterium]|nr:hypothetical protein [Muribaculaceae bacterium]